MAESFSAFHAASWMSLQTSVLKASLYQSSGIYSDIGYCFSSPARGLAATAFMFMASLAL